MKTVLSIFAFSVVASVSHLNAQDYRSDYKSGPVHYQPEDPWLRGKIFQIHTGHGGWFYNCDHQEDKRFSPYINWHRQPCWKGSDCPIACDIRQQLDEVKQRICWGQGGCCHRTDRLPPDSGYVMPYVDAHEHPGSFQHLEIAPENFNAPTVAPNAGDNYSNRQQTISPIREARRRAVVNPALRNSSTTGNSSRRVKSEQDKYLVDDPTQR